jgi:hypothetical protein
MKAKVAALLLICYAFILARPVAPVLQDIWAHVFNSSEHIATVHYENGSMHVHIEVKHAAEHSSSAPAESSSENLLPVVHLATENILLAYPASSSAYSFRPLCANFSCTPLTLPDPPPWMVC